ncbi:MAG TPA: hypothetical protein VG897_01490 [Terriglobales bacterium]|nr:hypothetical protein [Terriglobales bacterium]
MEPYRYAAEQRKVRGQHRHRFVVAGATGHFRRRFQLNADIAERANIRLSN